MKPRVIIVPSQLDKNTLKVSENYVKAVAENGGIPIISAYLGEKYIEEILNISDGIIFTGGNDPNPIFFGENPTYSLESSPKRDIFEKILCKRAFEENIPMLGICRGMQIIALSLGGKIYQDLQKEKENSFNHYQQFEGNYPYHSIDIKKDTRLFDILGKKKIYVNSFHHQAVSIIPKDFIASAISDDLVIEGMEYLGNNFILGLQFHPEMTDKNNTQRRIFKRFIEYLKGRRY